MIISKSDKSIGYQFSIEKHRNHAAMGPSGSGNGGISATKNEYANDKDQNYEYSNILDNLAYASRGSIKVSHTNNAMDDLGLSSSQIHKLGTIRRIDSKVMSFDSVISNAKNQGWEKVASGTQSVFNGKSM